MTFKKEDLRDEDKVLDHLVTSLGTDPVDCAVTEVLANTYLKPMYGTMLILNYEHFDKSKEEVQKLFPDKKSWKIPVERRAKPFNKRPEHIQEEIKNLEVDNLKELLLTAAIDHGVILSPAEGRSILSTTRSIDLNKLVRQHKEELTKILLEPLLNKIKAHSLLIEYRENKWNVTNEYETFRSTSLEEAVEASLPDREL